MAIIVTGGAGFRSLHYQLPPPRPKNSQLNSNLLSEKFRVAMPEWQHAMTLCIDEVLEN